MDAHFTANRHFRGEIRALFRFDRERRVRSTDLRCPQARPHSVRMMTPHFAHLARTRVSCAFSSKHRCRGRGIVFTYSTSDRPLVSTTSLFSLRPDGPTVQRVQLALVDVHPYVSIHTCPPGWGVGVDAQPLPRWAPSCRVRVCADARHSRETQHARPDAPAQSSPAGAASRPFSTRCERHHRMMLSLGRRRRADCARAAGRARRLGGHQEREGSLPGRLRGNARGRRAPVRGAPALHDLPRRLGGDQGVPADAGSLTCPRCRAPRSASEHRLLVTAPCEKARHPGKVRQPRDAVGRPERVFGGRQAARLVEGAQKDVELRGPVFFPQHAGPAARAEAAHRAFGGTKARQWLAREHEIRFEAGDESRHGRTRLTLALSAVTEIRAGGGAAQLETTGPTETTARMTHAHRPRSTSRGARRQPAKPSRLVARRCARAPCRRGAG